MQQHFQFDRYTLTLIICFTITMPKKRKHVHKRVVKNIKNTAEVTINDFANAKSLKAAAKKPINSISRSIKRIVISEGVIREEIKKKNIEREQNKDLNDAEVGNESYSETDEIEVCENKIKCKRNKNKTKLKEQTESTGADYPIDVWFMLSDYVRPEDVGRFAGICKKTLEVTCSAKFWFSLYRRFYRPVGHLPEELRPGCMARLFGLRTNVIRALHHFYPPFVNRPPSQSVQSLLRQRCVSVWSVKRKNFWLYYFKMREGRAARLHPARPPQEASLTDRLADLTVNSDQGFRLLQVACPDLISLPPIMGMTFTSLSWGTTVETLCMNFCLATSGAAPHPNCCTQVVLRPVINLKLLDWWHPLYTQVQVTPVACPGCWHNF